MAFHFVWYHLGRFIIIRTILPSYSGPGSHRTESDEGGVEMQVEHNSNRISPLPRYVKPDMTEPDYNIILGELQEYHRSLIGSSYYYIRRCEEDPVLCRIIHGGGKVFFHEIIDHESHGISDDDLHDALIENSEAFTSKGYCNISAQIDSKLRVLFDAR
jgi:hypothetical protein